MCTYTFESPRAQRRIEMILAALRKQRMTCAEMHSSLNISMASMGKYVRHLRSEPKRIFICDWHKTRSEPAAIYAVGNGPDAPRPIPLTVHEYNANRWKRIKADPEAHRLHKSAERIHNKVRRLKGKPQPWFAALVLPSQPSIAERKKR